MTRIVIALAALLAMHQAALAQQPATTAPSSGLRPVLGLGLTGGGETLVTTRFTDGTTQRVSSGGLVHIYAGAEVPVAPQWALQGTLGYHVDNSVGSNGDVRYSRMPLDVMAVYTVAPQVRLGLGVQHVSGSKLSFSGAAGTGSVKFGAGTGPLAEVEYLMNTRIGFKLRYVDMRLKEKTTGEAINGSHLGLMMSAYF